MKTAEKKSATPTVEIVTITPEVAKALLERNTNNRKLTPSIVNRYARILQAGEWKLNGDTIRIDNKGDVLDGQHRLAASVQTGIPFETLVVTGINRDTFDTIDTGKARTSADALFSSGMTGNAPLVASIANLGIKLETNTLRINRYIEPHVVREWVKKHPEVLEAATFVKTIPFLGFGPVLGLVYMIAGAANKEKAASFFLGLTSGENLAKGDPVYALREMLLKNKRNRGLHKADVLGMALKAWNAHVNDKQLHILRKSSTDFATAYAA